MKITDNVVSEQVFKYFQSLVFETLPWYFTSTSVECDENSLNDSSFANLSICDGQFTTDIGHYCNFILLEIAEKLDVRIRRIERARFGLLQPKPGGKYVNKPHIDQPHDHKVGLLYLNDSDGETIIYNEKYDPTSQMNMMDFYESKLNKTLTVKEKIECKSNRFVLFDGLHYHSSTCPTNVNRRIALNYNFSIET